jgi:hypothetical protein
MKTFIIFILTLYSITVFSQCTGYQIYESFSSTLPTQGGTWVATSMVYSTTPVRTGTYTSTFNATNDALRTPLISNPGVLSLWYRRSSNTTAWTLNVQTSPDGTTWTTRGSITSPSATWTQYTLNIGALGLTNVYIRLLDARASGTHERYVDDLSLTSTSSSANTLFPALSNCSQTVPASTTYTFTDIGGASDTYNNNMSQTFTFSPGTAGMKVEINFSSIVGELGGGGTLYDYIRVYNGPTTASTLIGTYTSTPAGVFTSTASGGELTVTFTSDVSTTNAGWVSTVYLVGTPLPVELLYFDGTVYPTFNVLKWSTASEHNSSYFDLERSIDGSDWRIVGTKTAAVNSNQKINYSHLDAIEKFQFHYYRLVQYDIDGKFKTYGPIVLDNTSGFKRVIKYVNLIGQEVGPEYKGIVIEIYEDGTSKKTIR